MKKALITGASGGIGRGIAAELSKNGFHIILCGNKNMPECEALREAIERGGGIAETYQADVSKEEDIKRLRSEAGEVSVLVNNAGIARQKLLWDITADEWDEMFAVNAKSVFLMCRYFARDMVSAKYGRIINISSVWGIAGASCETHYSASKAAVIGFTKALAKELAPSGVTVNCIAPGVIDTKMNAALGADTLNALAKETPARRLGTPEDIGAAAAYLASEKAGFITGRTLTVDGGFIL